jgi:hypothetical protein
VRCSVGNPYPGTENKRGDNPTTRVGEWPASGWHARL